MSRQSLLNTILHSLAILTLSVAHLLYYTRVVGYALFESRGGVQQSSGWTHYGGVDYAWTTPVHVPGCGLLAITADGGGLLGMLLILGGSLVAGWSLASVLAAAVMRRRALLGRYGYRTWLAVAGWGWVLVPVRLSWVYWLTVNY